MAGLRFSSAPETEDSYRVGDRVEVFCDHDNDTGDRVRGDPKIVAVQFKENVYLTDGWMVPDHVLWCPHDSKNMRKARQRKRRPRSDG